MRTKRTVRRAGYVAMLTQVDYFNKRRILDERQKQFYAEAEARVAAQNK